MLKIYRSIYGVKFVWIRIQIRSTHYKWLIMSQVSFNLYIPLSLIFVFRIYLLKKPHHPVEFPRVGMMLIASRWYHLTWDWFIEGMSVVSFDLSGSKFREKLTICIPDSSSIHHKPWGQGIGSCRSPALAGNLPIRLSSVPAQECLQNALWLFPSLLHRLDLSSVPITLTGSCNSGFHLHRAD